jgi:aminomethyltransferase
MDQAELDALHHSPIHDRHLSAGAKFAAFGGWAMPVEFHSGVIREHTAVRDAVGIFDVSHLGKLTVSGPSAADFVNRCLTNDLAKIRPGKAQYTLCCEPHSAGIVDDLLAYLYSPDHVLLMPNAANAGEVASRLQASCPPGVTVVDQHHDYAVFAVQGTKSDEVLMAAGLPVGHGYMSFAEAQFAGTQVVVCRTGYTGERGYELVVANAQAGALWDALVVAGEPFALERCGLGARDTLRTEMGYPLHGQDITKQVTPLQARLGWAVGWQKPQFWGRDALLKEKEVGPKRLLRGLVSVNRAIPRPGMSVTLIPDIPLCDITSGTYSPTLKKGIAMALVPDFVNAEAELGVDVRGRREIFASTTLPFVDTSVREL